MFTKNHQNEPILQGIYNFTCNANQWLFFVFNVKLQFKNIEFRYWILLFVFNFAETSSWKYFFM